MSVKLDLHFYPEHSHKAHVKLAGSPKNLEKKISYHSKEAPMKHRPSCS